MTDASATDSLRIGSLVGSWRIEGYAGQGAYGRVYRARRAGLSHSVPVALKVAMFPHDPRFEREAGVLLRVRHPSVPQLLDRGWWSAGPEEAYPYLVLEWVRGLPLYEWTREHRATQRQVLRAVAQVAGALDALHQEGCLHRDVKGDNILVEPAGRAVLMDYGSSTWAGAPPLTESLMPPNTPEYRSPEALRFQWSHWRTKEARYQARPADDLYALGVSAYRLVTRVYPPPGTEPEELKQQLQAPSPQRVPPQALNPRVVPEVSALIERMLAGDPEARGSAREVEEAAEAAAELLGQERDVPFLGPERPIVETLAVPVPAEPPMGSEPPAMESMAMPVPVRAEPRAHFLSLRPGIAAAAMILAAIAGVWWVGSLTHEEQPSAAQAEAPEAEKDLDADPTGLGDGGVPARVAAQESAVSVKAVSLEMPSQPLPGQRRAPCRRREEVEINGGCWMQWPNLTPPCGGDTHEWNGACYEPILERTRVPTSKQPR